MVDEEFIQPPECSGVVGERVCVGCEHQMEEGGGRGAGGLGEIRTGGRRGGGRKMKVKEKGVRGREGERKFSKIIE